MRRKAADEVQIMVTTATTNYPEGRPVRVFVKAELEPYLESLRKAAIETLVADGMSIAAATDWVVQAERKPGSAEAMRHYRGRWVTVLEEPIDWVSEEVLDELEAQLLEQRTASAPWRRLIGGAGA